MTHKFSFVLTETLYLDANKLDYWLRIKNSKSSKILISMAIISLILSVGCSYLFTEQPNLRSNFLTASAVLAFSLVGMLIMELISYLFLPRLTLKLYSQQKMFGKFQNFEVTDESFNMTSEYSDTRLPYHMAFKWAENDKVFLIYHSVMTFSVISKEAADRPAIDYLRSRLQNAGIAGFSL